jgi:hypothetical protein
LISTPVSTEEPEPDDSALMDAESSKAAGETASSVVQDTQTSTPPSEEAGDKSAKVSLASTRSKSNSGKKSKTKSDDKKNKLTERKKKNKKRQQEDEDSDTESGLSSESESDDESSEDERIKKKKRAKVSAKKAAEKKKAKLRAKEKSKKKKSKKVESSDDSETEASGSESSSESESEDEKAKRTKKTKAKAKKKSKSLVHLQMTSWFILLLRVPLTIIFQARNTMSLAQEALHRHRPPLPRQKAILRWRKRDVERPKPRPNWPSSRARERKLLKLPLIHPQTQKQTVPPLQRRPAQPRPKTPSPQLPKH